MGLYITIEGPDGTGKTTQINLTYEKLKKLYPDKNIIKTKEPGTIHDNVCVKIREIILNPENKVCDKTALLLFLADRAQHINNVVAPALKDDAIILSDRSSLSTIVYHYAKHYSQLLDSYIDDTYFYEMLDFAQQIKPDLCFITSSTVEWANRNLNNRGFKDRIELFGDSFHSQVHSLFEQIANPELILDQNHKIFYLEERMKTFPKKVMQLSSSDNLTEDFINNKIMKNLIGLLNGES